MKLAEAAFANLLFLARIDGLVSTSERNLLERYRRALGISTHFAENLFKERSLKPHDPKTLEGTPAERRHILKMLIRVAHADGAMSRRERKLLKRVAESISIPPIEFADLAVEIEQEMGVQRRLRASRIYVLITFAAAILVVAVVIIHLASRTEEKLGEAEVNLAALKSILDEKQTQAQDELRRVEETQKNLSSSEATLIKRLGELEKEGEKQLDEMKNALSKQKKNQQKLLDENMASLQKELARVREEKNQYAVFKEIEKEYHSSILLIFMKYDLVKGQNRISRAPMGTGFFVTSCGHIVTNKHVVQPWKFDGDDLMLISMGYAVDKASLLLAAWPAGAEVKDKNDFLKFDSAYVNAKKTLTIHETTPDSFVVRAGSLGSGGVFQGRYHTLDHGDLAVLKASVKKPVKPFPLALEEKKVQKLDPVMVLGFPAGLNIIENTVAETSPSTGEVRKVQESIMVTAPIVPGNSGGPLLDLTSSVIGVASKIYGDSTLGSCIPVRHALPLLPKTPDLLKEVSKNERAGKLRAALDDLHLAGLRCSGEAEQKAVDTVKKRLFKSLQALLDAANGKKEKGEKKKALQELVERFGSRWGRESAESLQGL